MKEILIAPCGMNCNLCMAYLREKNTCSGCRDLEKTKSKYIRKCIIRNCSIIKENNWRFCSPKCEKYPCQRLKSLDKRYRTRYGMSMIENLEFIMKQGMKKFLKSQEEKYKCPKCGSVICVHNKKCYGCEGG
jgi:hypothetical protein